MDFNEWNNEVIAYLRGVGYEGHINAISDMIINQHQDGVDSETAAQIIAESLGLPDVI